MLWKTWGVFNNQKREREKVRGRGWRVVLSFLALAEVKILDFSHVQCGPICIVMLADMGAEVVRTFYPISEIDGKGQLFQF
jgi:hypothetical protein